MTISDLELGTICYLADAQNQTYQGYIVTSKDNDDVLLYPYGGLRTYEELPSNPILLPGVSIQDIQTLVDHTRGKIRKPNKWNSDVLDKFLDKFSDKI